MSSPEEVTTDIDKMSLQEKKSASTGVVKRMRISPENIDTGLLFKSLTNSIFQVLVENQPKPDTAVGAGDQPGTELTPMEQLLMKPFDPTLGKMSVEESADGVHPQFQFSSQILPPNQNKTVINVTKSPTGIQGQVVTTRKGSDSDSLSSSKSSNHSHVSGSKGSNPESPYSLQGGNPFGSVSSPPDSQPSPGYMPMSNDSAFSEMSSEPSPIESLLMSPGCILHKTAEVIQNPESDPMLHGKLKAFEEQQIVPNGEYIGLGLDEVEQFRDMPSVYIAEDGKITDDLVLLKDDEECDFFSDVEAELNEDGITIDDLDLQLHEFNRFQCPLVKSGFNMTQKEIEGLINNLSQLAITLQTKFEIMTCEEIKTRHKAYLVSQTQVLCCRVSSILLLKKETTLYFINTVKLR